MFRQNPQPFRLLKVSQSVASGQNTYDHSEMASFETSLVQGVAKYYLPHRVKNEYVLIGSSRLFNTDTFADLKVFIGNKEVPAHSSVLACQSEYFATALRVPLLESRTKEFRFVEGSPYAYWRVFQYIYRGSYADETLQEFDTQGIVPFCYRITLTCTDDEELVRHVRVYALADYFGIKGLKNHALSRLQTLLSDLWMSDRFSDCIREVYESTRDEPESLRALVTRVAHAHLGQLWERSEFKVLVHEGGDFAVDLIAQSAKKQQDGY
ncbi:hypothetical protein JX266_014034 [Neoarthrinium moseri]|nr:hypothetical protein JX266_014034 [Neoarthrinium moseri]